MAIEKKRGVEKRHEGSGKGRERRRKHDWKNGEEKTFYYCTLELCVGSFRRRRLVGSQIPDYFFVCCVPPLSLFLPLISRVCVKAFFFVAMILDWLAMGLMMIVLSMRRWRFAARGKAS